MWWKCGSKRSGLSHLHVTLLFSRNSCLRFAHGFSNSFLVLAVKDWAFAKASARVHIAAARKRGRQLCISLTPKVLKQLKELHVIVSCDQSEAIYLPSSCYTTLRARWFERVGRRIGNESVHESLWLVCQERCHYCHVTVMNGYIF